MKDSEKKLQGTPSHLFCQIFLYLPSRITAAILFQNQLSAALLLSLTLGGLAINDKKRYSRGQISVGGPLAVKTLS